MEFDNKGKTWICNPEEHKEKMIYPNAWPHQYNQKKWRKGRLKTSTPVAKDAVRVRLWSLTQEVAELKQRIKSLEAKYGRRNE